MFVALLFATTLVVVVGWLAVLGPAKSTRYMKLCLESLEALVLPSSLTWRGQAGMDATNLASDTVNWVYTGTNQNPQNPPARDDTAIFDDNAVADCHWDTAATGEIYKVWIKPECGKALELQRDLTITSNGTLYGGSITGSGNLTIGRTFADDGTSPGTAYAGLDGITLGGSGKIYLKDGSQSTMSMMGGDAQHPTQTIHFNGRVVVVQSSCKLTWSWGDIQQEQDIAHIYVKFGGLFKITDVSENSNMVMTGAPS